MQLELELTTFNFRSERHKGCINLVYTSGLIFNAYENFFRQYELTTQQYNILRILRVDYPDPVSTSVLRERMLDKMSDVSRLVSRLKNKNLVSVTPNPADKRLVNIVLSEKGIELMHRIDEAAPLLDSMLVDLDEQEASTLNSLLDKVRDSVRKFKI
ncbi:MarR family winged helix-turn-helix transcriptional regulator [Pontibacter beigongshangensis]|uniref:MarR family winged helix-turn-helix transcriptional regulator n=1 Tax=Pontibacter beigongshangensis TaxID=2574733 RepID=UPI00165017C3|nr:MarR family transcriptional regulator [Pontibacter beigongshangensis]